MRLYLCDSNKALLMTMKSYDACLEPYCGNIVLSILNLHLYFVILSDANKLEVIGKNSLEFENLFDTFDINLKENIKSLLTVYTANIVSSCKRKVDEVEHDAKKQVLLKLGHSKQTVSNVYYIFDFISYSKIICCAFIKYIVKRALSYISRVQQILYSHMLEYRAFKSNF